MDTNYNLIRKVSHVIDPVKLTPDILESSVIKLATTKRVSKALSSQQYVSFHINIEIQLVFFNTQTHIAF